MNPESNVDLRSLVVQIPCYNEAADIAAAIVDVPGTVPGLDRVQVLVIDDGSTDGSAKIAREAGATVVSHKRNLGLARAFRTGLRRSLELGADVIVNFDADCQYVGADIPKLVAPILEGRADIVVGDRRPHQLGHFHPIKRLLQRLGSSAVRLLSGTEVTDAVSGFRALSAGAARTLNIVSPFSYTIEMLIQAGARGLTVVSVPVETRQVQRPSRLARGVAHFLARSQATMLRMYAMYRPLSTFMIAGILVTLVGLIPVGRFLYFYFLTGDGSGHVQSLVLGGVLVVVGFLILVMGVLADLIGFNRQLIEQALERIQGLESRIPVADPADDRRES